MKGGRIIGGDVGTQDVTRIFRIPGTFNVKTDAPRAVEMVSATWKDGVRLGVMMGRSKFPGSDDPEVQDGEYYGGKWGIYLRAPDLWFELLDEFWNSIYPLRRYRRCWRGITSGNDSFFFPIDASDQCLTAHPDPTDFKTTYGVPRKAVESGQVKLVRCGEGRGEIRPIEAKYLEPEVHSLMEIRWIYGSPRRLHPSDSSGGRKTRRNQRQVCPQLH